MNAVPKSAVCVIGIGYVGTSLSILLSKEYRVSVLDIDTEKIANFNSGKVPIADADAEAALLECKQNIFGTAEPELALSGVSTVIICTPTNFDEPSGQFDTSSVEASIRDAIQLADNPNIVIKSTVPIGFTDRMRGKFGYQKIFFSPEFLREGSAYADNLSPSRIVVGDSGLFGKRFGQTLSALAINDPPVLTMSSREAEAVKLMSNSYLAMRVAYFNEVDSLALSQGLQTRNLIEGICSDPRIGGGYNNPSFGYGGYCFPKDTNQLRAEYDSIPQKLVGAIVEANQTRIDFLSQKIIERADGGVIGIYRLLMKARSDNIRSSATMRLVERLTELGAQMILFEPLLECSLSKTVKLIGSLTQFKEKSDLIVANRVSPEITDVLDKTFTRDIFNEN